MRDWTDANGSYDPASQEIACGICCHCKDKVPVNELTEFASGDRVCNDCMTEYLKSMGADFVEDYIADSKENQWAYLFEWWFKSLDKSEQLEILKAGYLAKRLDPLETNRLAVDRVEFCKDQEEFLDFVKEKLL